MAVPSLITHAVLGVAAAEVLDCRRSARMRLRLLSVVCATIPDLDALGLALGVPYGALLGHRGLSHSLTFAVVFGVITAAVGYWGTGSRPRHLVTLAAHFALLGASHGLLDAMTNGGLGIAFFSPFDPSRHFLPWRPMVVAPLSLAGLFTERGARMLISEISVVWLPSLVAIATAIGWRRSRDARDRLARAVATVDGDEDGVSSPRANDEMNGV